MEPRLLALFALYAYSRAPISGVPNRPGMMNDALRESLRVQMCQCASALIGQDVPENYDAQGNWISPFQH